MRLGRATCHRRDGAPAPRRLPGPVRGGRRPGRRRGAARRDPRDPPRRRPGGARGDLVLLRARWAAVATTGARATSASWRTWSRTVAGCCWTSGDGEAAAPASRSSATYVPAGRPGGGGGSSWTCRKGSSRHAHPGPDHLPGAVRALRGDQPGRAGGGARAAAHRGPRPAGVHRGPPQERRRRAVRRRWRDGDDGATLDPGGAGAGRRAAAPAGAAVAAGAAAGRREGARARRARGADPPVRPVRGDRRAGAPHGGGRGGLDRRLRSLRRRAAGDGADRGRLPAGAGGGGAGRRACGRTASAAVSSTTRTTRGRRWSRGCEVPEVLLSGNHAAIDRWRESEALRATLEKRSDEPGGLGGSAETGLAERPAPGAGASGCAPRA